MLVVPPRSQTLKLALTYQDWEVIGVALELLFARQSTEKFQERTRSRLKYVNEILAQLRQEGHV